MRISTALIGCVLLVVPGCAGWNNSTPPPPVAAGPTTEIVPLKLAFDDTFPETEGAKRVIVCQLRDERAPGSFVGEGPVSGDGSAVTKYVMKDDPTLTLPRVLGKEIKTMGLNVTPAERLSDPVGGEPVREILKRTGGDYLIAGRLEELSLRGRGDAGKPVFATVSVRLDIYNKAGELRMYYPARRSDAEFLGDKAGDPNEVNALLERTVDLMVAGVVEDPYFVKALDLDPDTVKQMRAGTMKPACPPAKPEEAKPAETPAEMKPTEKPAEPAPAPTDAERKAKDLEDAVKDAPK